MRTEKRPKAAPQTEKSLYNPFPLSYNPFLYIFFAMTTETRKEQVLSILKEGRETAGRLPDSDLKERLLDHFTALEDCMEKEDDCVEVEMLARELVIGVKEALSFKDMDILAEVEVNVWNDISDLKK